MEGYLKGFETGHILSEQQLISSLISSEKARNNYSFLINYLLTLS